MGIPIPRTRAAMLAKIRAISRLLTALLLITFANSKGSPVAPSTAMIIPTVLIAINNRPKVIPPLAKLFTTFMGCFRISGFKKLKNKRQVSAIMAEPAAEKPAINAITTIEIGTTTRIRLIQSCMLMGSISSSFPVSTPRERDSKITVVNREA